MAGIKISSALPGVIPMNMGSNSPAVELLVWLASPADHWSPAPSSQSLGRADVASGRAGARGAAGAGSGDAERG